MSENYGISFAEYKREFTQDAGGAMLDRQAVADIKGVKVRACNRASLSGMKHKRPQGPAATTPRLIGYRGDALACL